MNRNVLIGLGVVAAIIVLGLIFMPSTDEPASDATAPATPPATSDPTTPPATPPATPAPAN